MEKPVFGASSEPLDPRAVLEVCLCHAVRRAARAMTRGYDAALAPAGLTAGQFLILAAAAAYAPLPLPTLRSLLALDRTSLNRTLKPMEKCGFIEVSRGAGRRPGRLILTADGAAAFRDAGPAWRGAQSHASERIGSARAGQLLTLLTQATAQLLR